MALVPIDRDTTIMWSKISFLSHSELQILSKILICWSRIVTSVSRCFATVSSYDDYDDDDDDDDDGHVWAWFAVTGNAMLTLLF